MSKRSFLYQSQSGECEKTLGTFFGSLPSSRAISTAGRWLTTVRSWTACHLNSEVNRRR